MNVYDFDNTIYRGDSSVDLYLWTLRRRPGVIVCAPRQLFAAFRYLLGGRGDKTAMKTAVYSYFRHIKDMDAWVERFWDDKLKNIKDWYKKNQRPDDVIVSASPEFLLRPACQRLGIKYLIASRNDSKTGVFQGKNCHGKEKVPRFLEQFPQARPENFYSDSLSDTPLSELALRRWLVKDDKLLPWPDDR